MSAARAAIAGSNIALAKYWGKADRGHNLSAVPSLSLTLAELRTTTRVRFDAGLEADEVAINGAPQAGRARERVTAVLDELRALAGRGERAEVRSENDFPTASGLASSASGFAALVVAASGALGLSLTPAELSRLARRASVSAARSIFPGFVELGAGAESAAPLAAPEFLDVRMVVAATTLGEKAVGSSEGMRHTKLTSAYYPAWVERAPDTFERAKSALLARDFEALGAAMEESALMMHASMLAARPALIYLNDSSLRVIERVRALRAEGVPAFFTMDAGPHVKILTPSGEALRVERAVAAIPGVVKVLSSAPGPGARLVEEA